jgi:hypothetical protein
MTAMRRPSKSAAKKSVAARRADATKRTRPQRRMPGIAAHDDTEVTALKLKPAKLSPAMATFFKSAEEKVGFVPNVLKAFAFDMTKLEAFLAYRNDLMLGESGLSKLEREIIAAGCRRTTAAITASPRTAPRCGRCPTIRRSAN